LLTTDRERRKGGGKREGGKRGSRSMEGSLSSFVSGMMVQCSFRRRKEGEKKREKRRKRREKGLRNDYGGLGGAINPYQLYPL